MKRWLISNEWLRLMGAAAWLVIMGACEDTGLNNVGNAPGDGSGANSTDGQSGSGQSGFGQSGSGQSGFGQSGFGQSGFGQSGFGSGGDGGSRVGGGSGFGNGGSSGFGVGGNQTGDGGSSGAFPGCFAPFEVYAAEDTLDLGPQNSVIQDAHAVPNNLQNSADQSIFSSIGSIWEVYANFPATTPELAAKTDIALPAQLATVPDQLGQLYVTRRSCAARSAAGRTLQVEVWWKPTQANATIPTHGFALGVVAANDATTWLPDTTKAFVVGDAAAKSSLDTLNRIILQYSFAVDDTTDARKIVLGVWLLDSQVFPSNFYIGSVEWK